MAKVKISEKAKLLPGDEIEIHVERIGFGIIKDFFGMMVEKKLRSNPGWEIYDWQFTNDYAIYRIRIKEPPPDQVQQAGVMSVAAVLAVFKLVLPLLITFTVYKIVDRIADTVESPSGKFGMIGLGGIGIAAAVITILSIIEKSKK